jgi:hypothetical protein
MAKISQSGTGEPSARGRRWDRSTPSSCRRYDPVTPINPDYFPKVGENERPVHSDKPQPLPPEALLRVARARIDALCEETVSVEALEPLLRFILSRETGRTRYSPGKTVFDLLLESTAARSKTRSKGPLAGTPIIKGRSAPTKLLAEDQLSALIDAFGRLQLEPAARRRMEEVFMSLQLGPSAERDKLRYGHILLEHERRRLGGPEQSLDDTAVEKMAHLFRAGGLTRESREQLGALLEPLAMTPEAAARLEAVKQEPVTKEHAEWTMFFLIGGRTLHDAEKEIVQALEKVGSVPGQLNLVVLIPGLDRRLLHIRKGEGEQGRIYSVAHAIDRDSELGDRFSERVPEDQDPTFVRAALKYVKKTFPSEHFAFGLFGDNEPFKQNTTPSILIAEDFRAALEGFDIDVLALDADNTAGFEHCEAAAEAGVKHLVGSGHFKKYSCGVVLPYDTLVRAVVEHTKRDRLGGAQLAELFTSIVPGGAMQAYNAIDLSKFISVRGKLHLLAGAMIEAGGLSQNPWLRACWDQCARGEEREEIALRELAQKIADAFGGPLAAHARALLAALDEACICGGPSAELAIHAPATEAYAEYGDEEMPWGRGPWVQLIETLFAEPDELLRIPPWGLPRDAHRHY